LATVCPSAPRVEAAAAPLPLSLNQEAALILSAAPTARAVPFQVARTFSVRTREDWTPLQSALAALVQRHRMLRVRFQPEASRPGEPAREPFGAPRLEQRLEETGDVPLRVETVDAGDPAAAAAEARRIVAGELANPFEIDRGPLIRALVVAYGREQALLLIRAHHLVADRGSFDVIERDLDALYRSRLTGADAELTPLSIEYSDFARDQRRLLESGELEPSVRYWLQRWRDYGESQVRFADLGAEVAPRCVTCAADRVAVTIDSARTAALRRAAIARHVTASMIVVSAFVGALHLRSGRRRLACWMHFANRRSVGAEGVVGWFANSHILGSDCAEDDTWASLLRGVRTTVLDAARHQDVPTPYLWRRLAGTMRNATSLVLPHVWTSFDFLIERRRRPGAAIARVDLPFARMTPGLQCVVRDRGNRLIVELLYSSERLRRADVEPLLATMEQGLERLTAAPDTPMSAIERERRS